MSDLIKAAKMALELLESAHVSTSKVWQRHDCCEALRAALAEAEKVEPHVCDKPSECRWHPWCAENNKCLSKFQDAMPAGAFGATKQEPT